MRGPLPGMPLGRREELAEQGGRILGVRLAKERKDSPRPIDAAVATVMAHDRAAALAGTVRDSIYI